MKKKNFTPRGEAERSDERKKISPLEDRPSAAIKKKNPTRSKIAFTSQIRQRRAGEVKLSFEITNSKQKSKLLFKFEAEQKKSFTLKPEN